MLHLSKGKKKGGSQTLQASHESNEAEADGLPKEVQRAVGGYCARLVVDLVLVVLGSGDTAATGAKCTI